MPVAIIMAKITCFDQITILSLFGMVKTGKISVLCIMVRLRRLHNNAIKPLPVIENIHKKSFLGITNFNLIFGCKLIFF